MTNANLTLNHLALLHGRAFVLLPCELVPRRDSNLWSEWVNLGQPGVRICSFGLLPSNPCYFLGHRSVIVPYVLTKPFVADNMNTWIETSALLFFSRMAWLFERILDHHFLFSMFFSLPPLAVCIWLTSPTHGLPPPPLGFLALEHVSLRDSLSVHFLFRLDTLKCFLLCSVTGIKGPDSVSPARPKRYFLAWHWIINIGYHCQKPYQCHGSFLCLTDAL